MSVSELVSCHCYCTVASPVLYQHSVDDSLVELGEVMVQLVELNLVGSVFLACCLQCSQLCWREGRSVVCGSPLNPVTFIT